MPQPLAAARLTVRRLAALELAPAVEAEPRRRRERLRALRRVKIARGGEDLLGERRREDLGVVRPERREADVGHGAYEICVFVSQEADCALAVLSPLKHDSSASKVPKWASGRLLTTDAAAGYLRGTPPRRSRLVVDL